MASSNVYRVVTGGSTGAAWVLVAGLSSASAEQSEFIILNGTTNVPTVSTYPRMNYLRAFSDVGSTATVGTIKATADTDSTVSAQINIGYTQSLMAVHSVPLAASALVLRWWGSLASKTAAMVTFRLLRGKLGHYQHVEQTRTVFSTGMSHFDFKLGPLNLEAGEDIWVNASSDTANTVVSGGFDLIRIND